MEKKNTYGEPRCKARKLDVEKCFCVSFDDKDHTETWKIEDEETI